MARNTHRNSSTHDSVQDSFLDIVANIVGILILLVIVVGIRAAMQPNIAQEQSSQSTTPLLTQTSVDGKRNLLEQTASQIADLRGTYRQLAEESLIKEDKRALLSLYIEEVESRLAEERKTLSTRDAERLDIRAQLAAADMEFDSMMLEKISLETSEVEPTKIVHTPTPIVRARSEHALHLRIEHGNVAIVPFDELMELHRSRNYDSIRRDLDRLGGVGQEGPIDGFVLRFVHLTRRLYDPVSGTGAKLTEIAGEVHPVKDGLGLPMREALLPNSALTKALARTSPQQTIVFAWTCSDSVKEYRLLEKELRSQGFAIDLRLLADGRHIAFGRNGRKTAAQ